MSLKEEPRKCKNKKCQKVLPAGYKHKYCEACRNQHAEKAKNVIKNIGTGTSVLATVALAVISRGKIVLKK